MKYSVEKHRNGQYRCIRLHDEASIPLKSVINWLRIDPKSAEPYFDHEFAKKTPHKSAP